MPRFICLFLCAAGLCFSSEAPSRDVLCSRVLANTLSAQYSLAQAQADSIAAIDPGAGVFFRNMVRISRFDDLGDTLDLLRSGVALDSTPLKDPFWESLRLFQLGYVKAELHSTIAAALTTRKAAQIFKTMPSLDAKAFYAIYAYYMEGATAWVPFTTDRRAEMLTTLEAASISSRWYWPLFSTSLAWMYFDRKEYDKALHIVERSLQRSPNHPVFSQMKGDMLFRLNRYPEAAQVYEASAAQYAVRAPYSIRWWSAAGNLMRIYAAMHDTARLAKWQGYFRDPRFERVRPWMPHSLLKALDDANLLP